MNLASRRAIAGSGATVDPQEGKEKRVLQERLRLACGRRHRESAALFDMTSRNPEFQARRIHLKFARLVLYTTGAI
jgi:hypothetical protein